MGIRVKPLKKPLSTSQQEEQRQVGGNLIQSGGESAFSGGTAPSSSAPSNQPAQAAPSATQQIKASEAAGQTRGTGFTGAAKYLQAAQGTQLGQQVAGRISQAGQQATQALGEAKKQFQTGLQQQQQQFGEAYKGAEGALGAIQQGQLAQPTAEQVRQYGAATSGQYAGPGGISQLAAEAAKRKLASASQLAQSARTAAGREGLLRETVGRGSTQYTGGKSALDALLLGQKAGEFAKAQRETAGVAQKFGLEQKRAEEQARQTQSQMTGQAQKLAQQRSAAEQQLKQQVAGQKAAYESGLDALISRIQREVGAGEISAETAGLLSQYGITPDVRFSPENITPLIGQLTQRGAPATFESSATEEQAKKLSALSKLAQESSPFGQFAGIRTLDPRTGLAVTKEQIESQFIGPQREKFSKMIEGLKTKYPEIASSIDLKDGFLTNKGIRQLQSRLPLIDREIGFAQQGIQFIVNNQTNDVRGDVDRIRTLQNKIASLNSQKTDLDSFLNEYNKSKALKFLADPRLSSEEILQTGMEGSENLSDFLSRLIGSYLPTVPAGSSGVPTTPSAPPAAPLEQIINNIIDTASPIVTPTKDPVIAIDNAAREQVEDQGGVYESFIGTPVEDQVRAEVEARQEEARNKQIQTARTDLLSIPIIRNAVNTGNTQLWGYLAVDPETGNFTQDTLTRAYNLAVDKAARTASLTEKDNFNNAAAKLKAYIDLVYPPKPSVTNPVVYSGGKNYGSEDEDSPVIRQEATAAALESLSKGKQLARPVNK